MSRVLCTYCHIFHFAPISITGHNDIIPRARTDISQHEHYRPFSLVIANAHGHSTRVPEKSRRGGSENELRDARAEYFPTHDKKFTLKGSAKNISPSATTFPPFFSKPDPRKTTQVRTFTNELITAHQSDHLPFFLSGLPPFPSIDYRKLQRRDQGGVSSDPID
jgi:hypothetical protein